MLSLFCAYICGLMTLPIVALIAERKNDFEDDETNPFD